MFICILASFSGKLFLLDGLDGRTRTIRLRERSDDCAICGEKPSIIELQDYPQFCGSGPDDKVFFDAVFFNVVFRLLHERF